jgi:tetratricopeptide (TPR) repeat protein
MDSNLAVIYLGVLIVLLGGSAIAILRQALKTRSMESRLNRLQNLAAKKEATAQDFYEYGSLLLDKKIYSQAIAQFQKCLKSKDLVGEENIALVYNALGFAYAAQEQYDLAIRQYKEALKLQPAYTTAMNNLGFSYEKKTLVAQALELYEEVLKYEPKNSIAKKRAESLKKRVA